MKAAEWGRNSPVHLLRVPVPSFSPAAFFVASGPREADQREYLWRTAGSFLKNDPNEQDRQQGCRRYKNQTVDRAPFQTREFQ